MSEPAAILRCDCHLAGVCRDFGYKAHDRRFLICSDALTEMEPRKREAYREIWRQRKAGKPSRSKSRVVLAEQEEPAADGGVGTELKALLWWFGLKPKEGGQTCKCDKRAAYMDKVGIEWCEQQFDLVIEWLREGASDLKVPFIETAARVLLKRAIANAKRNRDSGTAAAADTDNG
jgi:hypothetical protein